MTSFVAVTHQYSGKIKKKKKKQKLLSNSRNCSKNGQKKMRFRRISFILKMVNQTTKIYKKFCLWDPEFSMIMMMMMMMGVEEKEKKNSIEFFFIFWLATNDKYELVTNLFYMCWLTKQNKNILLNKRNSAIFALWLFCCCCCCCCCFWNWISFNSVCLFVCLSLHPHSFLLLLLLLIIDNPIDNCNIFFLEKQFHFFLIIIK